MTDSDWQRVELWLSFGANLASMNWNGLVHPDGHIKNIGIHDGTIKWCDYADIQEIGATGDIDLIAFALISTIDTIPEPFLPVFRFGYTAFGGDFGEAVFRHLYVHYGVRCDEIAERSATGIASDGATTRECFVGPVALSDDFPMEWKQPNFSISPYDEWLSLRNDFSESRKFEIDRYVIDIHFANSAVTRNLNQCVEAIASMMRLCAATCHRGKFQTYALTLSYIAKEHDISGILPEDFSFVFDTETTDRVLNQYCRKYHDFSFELFRSNWALHNICYFNDGTK